jgi:transposase
LQHLDSEIAAINKAVAELIGADEPLNRSRQLLLTIPGIGERSAAILLAEIPDFRAFGHNKQIAAFAGLSPQEHTSGSSVHGRPRISKAGNPRLRAALYMCALSARRTNPTLKCFGDRLKEVGKSPKVVLIAVARKLLVIAYGAMKSQRPFQPA